MLENGMRVRNTWTGSVGTIQNYSETKCVVKFDGYDHGVCSVDTSWLEKFEDAASEDEKLKAESRVVALCSECRADLAIGDKIWRHKQEPVMCLCCDAVPTSKVEIQVVTGKIEDVEYHVITNIPMEQDFGV